MLNELEFICIIVYNNSKVKIVKRHYERRESYGYPYLLRGRYQTPAGGFCRQKKHRNYRYIEATGSMTG